MKKFIPLMLVCLSMVGCSLLNLSGNTTDDEKARIALDVGLTTLDVAFTAGNLAVVIRPEYLPVWKGQVIPSMTVANHVALDFITIGEAGGIVTEAQIISTLQARAFEILALIAVWETKTNVKDKIVMKRMDTLKGKPAKSKAVKAEVAYPIPTYAQLRIKSNLLQAKLDAVK